MDLARQMNLIRTAILEKTSIAVIALAAGFLGSVLHDWVRGHTTSTVAVAPFEVLRAKRYEVVNESGGVLSFWGPDNDPSIPAATPKGTLLVFMNAKGQRGVEFGSRTGDKGPTLEFFDRSHRQRVSLALSQGDDPILGFSSTVIEGAVLLGAIEGDVYTDKPGDSWGLRLRSLKARSSIFASEWYDGTQRAGVRVVDERGSWTLPADPKAP
jgi:hypothetical protein